MDQPLDDPVHRRRRALLWGSWRWSSGTASPLIQVRIFTNRAFAVENLVLGVAMLVFVPVFFFASEYAQIALGQKAQQSGVYLLFFFLGFVVMSQIGGRLLDRSGAKRPVVIGCALATVGFTLWAGKVTQLHFGSQVWPVVISGGGMGLMLTPASTDAVNRAGRLSYGEATGITQTVRNFSASLGFAILGTILVNTLRSRVTTSLISQGAPTPGRGDRGQAGGQRSQRQGAGAAVPHFFRLDFAYATRTVLYIMAGIMAVAAVVAFLGLQAGVQEDLAEVSSGSPDDPGDAIGDRKEP